MIQTKKLIEVALPLEAINLASAREKSIRHGHPSTLHLWWARRPLAAARAVIFAQMVDDPSGHPDLFKTSKAQDKERQRLFRIMEELVKWENTSNEAVLQQARDEIWQSWRYTCAANADHPRASLLFDRYTLPAFHDPFAGGGTLPLEAQRLGLESYASDLNPVAVLINRAMIEIPPKFRGRAPVNPAWQTKRDDEKAMTVWEGVHGLAEDVRFYGMWMRDEAAQRLGHLYPTMAITQSMVDTRPDLEKYIGRSLTVIVWLWARTVKSPNPAFANVDVPLASTFMLSRMKGNEAYVEPIVNDHDYLFTVRTGPPQNANAAKNGTKLARGANFSCLMSGTPITGDYIKAEGKAGRMGTRLMAVVAEGERGRVYLSPTREMESIALTARPEWSPDTPLPADMRSHWTPPYGLTTFGDLFTPRQTVALSVFSTLVGEARQLAKRDALACGLSAGDDPMSAVAYSDAVAVYLGLVVSSLSDRMTTICTWDSGGPTWGTKTRNTFARQAIPMSWDFAEVNPLSTQSGSFHNSLDYTAKGVVCAGTMRGFASQADAGTQVLSIDRVVSTDPPYYDNIGYADLSDFFYVWLRRSLHSIYPDLFSTLAVPKAEELVAAPYRQGGKKEAAIFFLDGMTRAMHRLADQAHPAFPVTIYYAFKQSESDGNDGQTNTGWDTFLAAVIEAGFAITGTWPMRTELGNRMIGSGANALASSIVLVCRRREDAVPNTTRRQFVSELKAELPRALADLQAGNIAPVDLAQAAIGPGMAIFTRYKNVLNAEGESLSIGAAIALINQTLDDALAEQEGDFDPDTRWALTWFEQNGFIEGEYGLAEQLSKSKNTSVAGLATAGILLSKGGKVRLLKPSEFPVEWDPATDMRLTVWEMVHQLVRALEAGGESAAAQLVSKLGTKAETARELCYRLYTLCERKKRTAEALSYNGLVQSWPEISRLGSGIAAAIPPGTSDMFAKE
jgi:putative DNA methylase